MLADNIMTNVNISGRKGKKTEHLPLKWKTLLDIKIRCGDEVYEGKGTSRGNK